MKEVEDIYLPLSRLLSLYVAATQRLFIAQQHFLGTARSQGALHHRRRRLGRGRQIDHRARAAGAAGALAEHAEGRSRHHRRLPASQRGAGARRPDGEEGLSGKLRPADAAALSRRREGRAPAGARAGLLASRLRRDAEPVGRGRPPRHPDRRRAQRAAGRPPAEGRQGDPLRVGLLRFLGLSSTPRRTCCTTGTSTASSRCAAPRSAIRSHTSTAIRSSPTSEAAETATSIWERINLVNLRENILPTRQRADLILNKAASHLVQDVSLRRL